MVTTSSLLKSSGIVALQKRQAQQKKSSQYYPSQAQVQISQPTAPSTNDLQAQKKYEAELSAYNSAMQEKANWERAYALVFKGKGYAAKGDPELQSKVKYIEQRMSYLKSLEQLKQEVGVGDVKAPTQEEFSGPVQKGTSEQVFRETGKSVRTQEQGKSISLGGRFGIEISPSKTPDVNQQSLVQETQRYKDLGYTQSQANKLATESVRQGGMTYSPERAKEIVKPSIGEKIRNVYVVTNPLLLGAKVSSERWKQTVDVGKEVITKTREADKLESNIERLNKELKGINEVYGDEKTGTINLSGKKYEDYIKKYEDLEKHKREYEEIGGKIDTEGYLIRPTVQVGFSGRRESIDKFSMFHTEGFGKRKITQKVSKYVTGSGAVLDYLGASLFSDLGSGIEKTGIKIPSSEREIKYKYTGLAPYSSGTMQYDVLTGEPNLFIKSEGTMTIKTKEVTSEEIGEKVYKYGSGASRLGKYAIPYLGAGIFVSETGERVQESGGIKKYVKEKPVEATLTGLAIFSPVLIKGGGKLTKEFKVIEKDIPLKGREPFAYEKVSIRDGERVSEYIQFVERRPSSIKIKTTEFRERFPSISKPLSIKVTPAEFAEIRTLKPTALGSKKPFWVIETIKGKRYGTAYLLGGKSIPASLEEFSSLSKLKQEQWKRLAERVVKRKVKLEDVPMILNENIEKTSSLITSVKVARLTPSKRVLSIKTPFAKGFGGFGRTLEITEAVTAGKQIVTPSGLKITKDITMFEPKKTPMLKTTIFERTIQEEKTFTEFQGRGKKSSEQFFKQLYGGEQVGLPKIIPKVKQPKVIPRIKEPVGVSDFVQIGEEYPLMVGGKGLKTLPYAGTGQYEVQESISPVTISIPTQKDFTEQKPQERIVQIPKTQIDLKYKQPQIEILKPVLKEIELFKTIETTKVKESQKLRELVKVAERMKQDQLFKQALKLKQGQKMKQPTKLKPFTPKTRIPFKLPSSFVKKLGKKAEEGGFEAFAFKLGKEISISKGTKEKVSGELGEFLRKELSASGYLTLGGKKIKAEETGLLSLGEFRKSKTGKGYLVVEEKSLRLRKSGTGQKIQMWR